MELLDTHSVGVTSDSKLAQQLQQELVDSQLLRDAQLAEQLQLKENSYMTPRYICQGNAYSTVMCELCVCVCVCVCVQ